jgi:predicted RNase H-like HicB family nuclease
MKDYLVIYEWADGNWSAYSPDVPGCVSTGKTQDACKRNFGTALRLHFEGLREDGLPIPEPTALADRISIAA